MPNMTPGEELHTSESIDGLPTVTPSDRERLLTDLLRGVSRAFYLTLRVLPRGLREPMGLAYLLARAADTIGRTASSTSAGRASPTTFRPALRRPSPIR